MNNEPWLVRTTSHSTGTRTQSFCDAVHSRDGRCVISGEEVLTAHTGSWRGFEAAHIFPLAHEDHWIRYNYSRWITILPDRGGTINSVQNGLLLRTDIQQLFDGYDFSINPDVCVSYNFNKVIVANNYLRIITKLCSSPSIQKVSLASTLIKGFLMIPNDLSIKSCDGILGRLY